MAKRAKNETPAPILIACRANVTREEREAGANPSWDVLPERLYKGIQPTLKNDHLHLRVGSGHYFIPARFLLDLSRLWADEPYAVRVTLDLSNAILEVKSGREIDNRFTSRSEIKGVYQDAGPAEDLEYLYRQYSAVPFAFDDGEDWSEELRAKKGAPTPDPWILKAVSKDDARPGLVYSWGDFATDGIRAHIDRRLPRRDFAELGEYERPGEHDLEFYPAELERQLVLANDHGTLVSVDSGALTRALRLARSVNKEQVYLSANGRLDVWSEEEIWTEEEPQRASVTVEAGYEINGPDTIVLLNPRYLLEAVSGLAKGEILLSLPAYETIEGQEELRPAHALYVTDGTREALVQPLIREDRHPEG